MIKRINVGMALSMLAATVATAEVKNTIDKPVVLDDALLSITVSDFHGLLDGAGSVAAQTSPMMSGMMLKTLLGAQVGDPMLAGIEAGKGLAVVVTDATHAFAVIEIAEDKIAVYTNKLATLGVACRYGNGYLVVAKSAAELDKRVASASAIGAKLLAKRSPSIRVALQPARYISENAEQIQGMLTSLTSMMKMGMAQQAAQGAPTALGMERILEGEARVGISLAEQIQSFEINITPAAGAIRISEIMDPVAGSRLATLCNAPVKNKWNPKAQSGGLAKGAFTVEVCNENNKAMIDFVTAESDQLVTAMKLEGAQFKGIIDYMKKSMAICGGTVSESIMNGKDAELGFSYLMEVTDEAAALDLIKNMQADWEAFGFTKLYADAGMPMTFEFLENAREYQGVKIHQLQMKMSMENMPEEQRKQFEAMNLSNMKFEIGLLDGILAYSMGDDSNMNIAIDNLKTPTATTAPLVARTDYPAGGFFYGEIDMAKYIGFISAFIPQAEIKQAASMIKGAKPITAAGYRKDGRIEWNINIPGDLIARMGQAAMTIKMQQMQNMQQQTAAPQMLQP
jgi:hypothetical protein